MGLKNAASKAMGMKPEELDGKMIFERANAGDEAVIEAIDTFTKPIARLIYNIQIFNGVSTLKRMITSLVNIQ